VSLADAAGAMKFTAERCHVIVEGAAACAVAAARSPRLAADGHKKIVAVVSGGNIDLSRFASLTGACS
jgi:threonine dehydratase